MKIVRSVNIFVCRENHGMNENYMALLSPHTTLTQFAENY